MNTRRIRSDDARVACPRCGSQDARELSFSDTVEFRGLTLDVEKLLVSKCSTCGEKWFTLEQERHNDRLLRQTYDAKRDAVRVQMGLLSKDEVARIRSKVHLTQREASQVLGGGPKAFNKYESGEVLQSQAMDKLLRLIDVFGERAVAALRGNYAVEKTAIDIAPRNQALPQATINCVDIAFGTANFLAAVLEATVNQPFVRGSSNDPQVIAGWNPQEEETEILPAGSWTQPAAGSDWRANRH
ncbi:type II toxin-antitoxin system MqsA family antitoxin [Paraburkholderia tropica]|uniref:type II toxin-antitoxin system MqsA family antitoxin n=1 Tax=Paraburkholderia tropica TaxID=92647 RepID=UPI002AB6D5E5|nr:type II toxin-antitoxin system MqsA family antitoxin [Paraburkholderia tropica]